MISENDRNSILDLARRAVEAAASGEALPSVPDEGIFTREGGAFVTLKQGGALRGCIGHFTGTGSLGKTVVEMAASAAVRDPRFSPVEPGEVEDLEIDISLLSPMVSAAAEDVVPGTHGVYIKYGFSSGTLLPQVATETGWDRETFLSHTCLKAGLPYDCWKRDGVQIFTYTAEVFSEKEKGADPV
jgi:AmmeMemoRadiSam system protein A